MPAGAPSTVTIVAPVSGITSFTPVFSCSVSDVVVICVIFPRSTISVCGTRLITTLSSTCDHLPGIFGICGGAPAPAAAPAHASRKSVESMAARLRMVGLSPGAVTQRLRRRKGQVKQRAAVSGDPRPFCALACSHHALRSVGQLAPSPTSPVNVPSTCAGDSNPSLATGRSLSRRKRRFFLIGFSPDPFLPLHHPPPAARRHGPTGPLAGPSKGLSIGAPCMTRVSPRSGTVLWHQTVPSRGTKWYGFLAP